MGAVYSEATEAHGAKWPWVVVAVALALVAVFLVLGHQTFRAIERSATEEFNRRQLVLAREAAHGIALYFRTLAASLRPLALDPDVQKLTEASTRRDLKLKAGELKPLGIWDVGVLDAAGKLRYSATDPSVEGGDFSARRYFQQAKAATSSDTHVVEFIEVESLVPGSRALLVGVPMFEAASGGTGVPPVSPTGQRPVPPASGRFAGVVACVVNVDFLANEFVAEARPSEGGHAVLLDESGDILWCIDPSRFGSNALKQAKAFPKFQQVAAKMLAGETGTAELPFWAFDAASGHYTDQVEQKLIAYAPVRVAEKPWSIGVWAPKADALRLVRSAYHTQQLEMGFSILVVLAGCFAALVMFHRISRSLERKVQGKTRELQESHERLLTVLDSLDAIVYVADMETHEVLFVNRYTRDLFGDVVGRTCWQSLQEGQEGACDFCTNPRLLDANGEPTGVVVWEFQNTVNGRWYEMHDRAIRWQDGRMVRLEIAVDVTERRRQEQQIVEQNRQLRETQKEIETSRGELSAAADQVAELIDTAARDQSMDLSYTNPHLVACWQVRSCTNTWCPCHGREPMRCWQVDGTSCDQEAPSSFAEKVIQCRNCEVFRRSAPDRLTELAEGFNNMMFLLRRKGKELSQLRYHAIQQERMATIGQMAAGIAHEIDNPLASLFSLVQVLKTSASDEEAAAQLGLMRQCIDRISKIVREIVDFGRPVGSEDWTYGDVEKIVMDTLHLVRYDRRARSVEMSVDFEPGLPKTLLIEHQLQQVFMNVILNALDAMAGRGKLTVRGYRTDGTIDVAVTDTGVGIRPEDLQHIFEPFYSVKSNRKGTGLGLAMSYNILQRHGGTVRVESEQGKGSTFVISIPLREPGVSGQ